jgi:uncharacterized YigZ family protein
MVDEYKTLAKPSNEVIFKDRASKFLGYAYPISTEKEVTPIITKLKHKHQKARHWCYAWRIGVDNISFRANDDGEPNNSAGQPIYGQIESFGLTNVLIVVVRYFGGTKLGVGGLINAYRNTAKFTLMESKIISRTVNVNLLLQFEYADTNKIIKIIKERNINIVKQEMLMQCKFEITIRKKDSEIIKKLFENLRCVKIELIN